MCGTFSTEETGTGFLTYLHDQVRPEGRLDSEWAEKVDMKS